MADGVDLLNQTEQFKRLLVRRATGDTGVADSEYRDIRRRLIASRIGMRLPEFVRECRTVDEFWDFIQPKFSQYRERRRYLQDEFSTLLELLESGDPLVGFDEQTETPSKEAADIRPRQIFVSYSHKDKEFLDELLIHLSPLIRCGSVGVWHDGMISPGDEWNKRIAEAMSGSDIILLLVSPHFIASRFCYTIELKDALLRHDSGTASVVPVVIRPCVWENLPFGKLQALPSEARPVSRWADRDDAWTDVMRGVQRLLG